MWFVFIREFDRLLLDYSRQRATVETMDKLLNLAKVRADVYWQIFIELQQILLGILSLFLYAGCSVDREDQPNVQWGSCEYTVTKIYMKIFLLRNRNSC